MSTTANLTTPAHLERFAAMGKTDRLFLTLGPDSDVAGLQCVIQTHFANATRLRMAGDNTTNNRHDNDNNGLLVSSNQRLLCQTLGQHLPHLQQVQLANFDCLPVPWLTGLLQANQLKMLELHGVHLVAHAPEHVTELCDALAKAPSLSHVEWCFCQMSTRYSSTHTSTTTSTTNHATDNHLFGHLVAALAHVPTLQVVELSGEYRDHDDDHHHTTNHLELPNPQALGDLCRSCPMLQKLSLNNIGITGEHVHHLLEPLSKPSCALQDLRLCLDRAGVLALHDVLQVNASLEMCWIWPRQPNNDWSHTITTTSTNKDTHVDCLVHLADALRYNATLIDFRVWGLNVRWCAAHEAAFGQALHVNTSLQTLKLGNYRGPRRSELEFYLRLNAATSKANHNARRRRQQVLANGGSGVDMVQVLAEHARDFPALAYYVRVNPALWLAHLGTATTY